mmetsp:Transcript_9607/g.34112  ORF Transcript_9607/g.34112 Transcript_9607/m.34112 type:complete len:326 (-) Transcript_9607:2-979(-)
MPNGELFGSRGPLGEGEPCASGRARASAHAGSQARESAHVRTRANWAASSSSWRELRRSGTGQLELRQGPHRFDHLLRGAGDGIDLEDAIADEQLQFRSGSRIVVLQRAFPDLLDADAGAVVLVDEARSEGLVALDDLDNPGLRAHDLDLERPLAPLGLKQHGRARGLAIDGHDVVVQLEADVGVGLRVVGLDAAATIDTDDTKGTRLQMRLDVQQEAQRPFLRDDSFEDPARRRIDQNRPRCRDRRRPLRTGHLPQLLLTRGHCLCLLLLPTADVLDVHVLPSLAVLGAPALEHGGAKSKWRMRQDQHKSLQRGASGATGLEPT